MKRVNTSRFQSASFGSVKSRSASGRPARSAAMQPCVASRNSRVSRSACRSAFWGSRTSLRCVPRPSRNLSAASSRFKCNMIWTVLGSRSGVCWARATGSLLPVPRSSRLSRRSRGSEQPGPGRGHMPRSVKLIGAAVLAASAIAWLLAVAPVLVTPPGHMGLITGVGASPKGPEAGVWVIAETDDTPTHFRKIVVTGDQGKFLVPDLPKEATFKVWVRGYGLADSKPVMARPDRDLKLAAQLPKDAREAAQVYPASYWASLIEPPKASEFPGTGPTGNGIN